MATINLAILALIILDVILDIILINTVVKHKFPIMYNLLPNWVKLGNKN